MDDPLHRAVVGIADGIGALAGRDLELLRCRHELAGDSIIRIGGVAEIGHGRRDGDGVTPGDGFEGRQTVVRRETGVDERGGRAEGLAGGQVGKSWKRGRMA